MKICSLKLGIAALLTLPALILSSCNMGGSANKDEVYKIIDEYFAEKGDQQVESAIERIIEKKRRGPTVDDIIAKRIDVSIDGAAVKGPADAPITIVEFSDFQCPFCQAVLPNIEQVMKNNEGKIKLAFRHNALPRHPQASFVHMASMAAQEQGKFWEFHDIVFKEQRAWGGLAMEPEAGQKQSPLDKKIMEYAKQAGLDVARFEQDYVNKRPEYEKRLEADANFARSHGAGGTPSFFINGALVVGMRPAEFFQEVIDKLLAEES